MDLYRFDRELQIVDEGQCDCDAALARLDECCDNALKSCDSGEESLASTSFGLSRSDEDFIEVSCHGRDSITVHSDRLCHPSWFSKTFGLKRHLFIKGDKSKGKEVVRDYFCLGRQTFEAKHAGALCR